MGGCRCAFRDCPVGTVHYPGMHFFHFPINEMERYIKWMELANKRQFIDMPLSFQKNRVVCARHFRVECFTNYKMNRLINNKTVAPTLMRLNEDTAYDYEHEKEKGGPELIKIPKCVLKHLIPPPHYVLPFKLHDNINIEKIITLEISPKTQVAHSLKRSPSPLNTGASSVKKFKVLNSRHKECAPTSDESEEFIELKFDAGSELLDVSHNSEEHKSDQEEEKELTNADIEEFEIVDLKNCLDDRAITLQIEDILRKQKHSDTCTKSEKQLSDAGEKEMAEESEMSTRIQQLEAELRKTKEQLKVKTTQLQTTEENLAAMNQKHQCLLQKYETLSRQDKSLLKFAENRWMREKCDETIKQKQQQQVEIVTTSKATSNTVSAGNSNAQATAAPHLQTPVAMLSKAQLFNGVKKYMSSTMVALVRMEMFGNADREWKPDEKRAAMDLLQLGEQIYKYVNDEWRFRLPALQDVRSWLADATTSFEDEEDL